MNLCAFFEEGFALARKRAKSEGERKKGRGGTRVHRTKWPRYTRSRVVGRSDDERDKEESEMKPVMGEALRLSFLLLSERKVARAAGL